MTLRRLSRPYFVHTHEGFAGRGKGWTARATSLSPRAYAEQSVSIAPDDGTCRRGCTAPPCLAIRRSSGAWRPFEPGSSGSAAIASRRLGACSLGSRIGGHPPMPGGCCRPIPTAVTGGVSPFNARSTPLVMLESRHPECSKAATQCALVRHDLSGRASATIRRRLPDRSSRAIRGAVGSNSSPISS